MIIIIKEYSLFNEISARFRDFHKIHNNELPIKGIITHFLLRDLFKNRILIGFQISGFY